MFAGSIQLLRPSRLNMANLINIAIVRFKVRMIQDGKTLFVNVSMRTGLART
jgi:hypothetical protein